MAVGYSTSVVAGLDCGLSFVPVLSVTHSASAVTVCGLWRYMSVMFLPFAPSTKLSVRYGTLHIYSDAAV